MTIACYITHPMHPCYFINRARKARWFPLFFALLGFCTRPGPSLGPATGRLNTKCHKCKHYRDFHSHFSGAAKTLSRDPRPRYKVTCVDDLVPRDPTRVALADLAEARTDTVVIVIVLWPLTNHSSLSLISAASTMRRTTTHYTPLSTYSS